MRRHREAEPGEEDRADVEPHHEGDLDLVLRHGDDVEHRVLHQHPVISRPLSGTVTFCGRYDLQGR